ncbi:hypothetical protein [Acinetobacter beijerinckii]|uniref:hypothetical protein n=1 Tax=Acinetobacter beijerinckii TaxID=262668 RepID=UPI003AF8A5BA
MSKKFLVGLKNGRVTYLTIEISRSERIAMLDHGCDSIITCDLEEAPDFKKDYLISFVPKIHIIEEPQNAHN